MIETDRFEQVELDSEQALWDWLEANHQSAETVVQSIQSGKKLPNM